MNWNELIKQFFSKDADNRLTFVLIAMLLFTNWYQDERIEKLNVVINNKNKRIDELQALRDVDNIRVTDMVNDFNTKIQEQIKDCSNQNIENLKDYMELHKEYDKLYSLTKK